MKVFEFLFNPKAKKKDVIFDTFCFSPDSRKEKRLGNLYLAGIVKNALPQNLSLLEKLAGILKTAYYQSISENADENFKGCLLAANQFLEKEVARENTAWLGNLGLVIFSLDQGLFLRFSGIGGLCSLVFKKSEVLDIGKSVASQADFNRGSFFQNMLTAQLVNGDKVLVFNQEIFEALQKEKILTAVAGASQKKIKKIFKQKKKVWQELSGFCLLVFLEKETVLKRMMKAPVIRLPKKKPQRARLKRVSSIMKKPGTVLLSRVGKQRLKTGLISLVILIFLLLLGYLIF